MDKRFCSKPYRLQMLQPYQKKTKWEGQTSLSTSSKCKMGNWTCMSSAIVMLDLCRTIKNRMCTSRVARILLNVKAFLHEQLAGSWTGRGRTIPWQPWTTELNRPEFLECFKRQPSLTTKAVLLGSYNDEAHMQLLKSMLQCRSTHGIYSNTDWTFVMQLTWTQWTPADWLKGSSNTYMYKIKSCY
jgi:hypothetical protein